MFEDLFMYGIIIAIAIVLLFVFIIPGIILVRADEVGIKTRKMLGKTLPQGKVIATTGEVGIQADILMPGLYYFFPIIWHIEKENVTEIPSGNIGIVSAIDGKPIRPGRLLGDEVDCNSFQDAKMFLDNGGCKGPQIGILKPGTYRINTRIFNIDTTKMQTVPSDKVGIVTAIDGIPLGTEFAIAPEPTGDHGHFQNGQAFINASGYRGIQLETLQAGGYYISPLLFKVDIVDMAFVPAGNVAVIVSSVGKELDKPIVVPSEISQTPDLNQPLHDAVETVLITNKKTRGIWKDPVAPGKYNLNTSAYRAEIVPTSAVTIDWASPDSAKETIPEYVKVDKSKYADNTAMSAQQAKIDEFFRFGQLRVTSQDGFQLDVDVRLIIRIPPADAPFIIARFGTVHNLIEQVAHPLIDASFRNEAGKEDALKFVHSRAELQETALIHARKEFEKYHVEVQGLLISYIRVDEALLETQTKKQIALQQQEQYKEEAKAQEERIDVSEKTARADKQKDVIAALLGIDIAKNDASAMRERSYGTRDSTKAEADGSSYASEQIGIGTAKAYEAQKKAIGEENVAMLQAIQKIAEGKIVITPNVLVTSGESGSGSNVLTAYLSMLIAQQNLKPGADVKPGTK